MLSEQSTIETPTIECVGELPRWAQLAFAARCARRVEFIVLQDWPGAPEEYVNLIEQSITHVESAANNPQNATEDAVIARDAAASITDEHAQKFNSSSSDSRDIPAILALYSASEAAYIGSRVTDGDYSNLISAVSLTASSALKAAHKISDRAGEVVQAGIQRDFELLVYYGEIHSWNDDSPVSPDVFGTMWQGLAPEGCAPS